MRNFTLTKISIGTFTTRKVNSTVSKKQGIKNGTQPRFEKCYSRLAECHHLRQGMRSPGGHWSAESRLDLSSRPLAIRGVVSLSLRGDYKEEGGRRREARLPDRKNLKRFKDYKFRPWYTREGPVLSHYLWIWCAEKGCPEGDPLAWVPGTKPRYEKAKRGALRISNRSANRIKYFMENVL